MRSVSTLTSDWHANALRGQFGPIHQNDPQIGTYRVRGPDGAWFPAAIWEESGGALVGSCDLRFGGVDELWVCCCRQPITEEIYWRVIDGAPWPDAPPENGARSNLPDDPFEALRVEIEGEVAEVERWLRSGPVADQSGDQLAKNWSERIRALGKKADALRDEAKRPHLLAGREIDAKWSPLLARTEELRRLLAGACEAYRKERQRLAAEAAAKATVNGAAPARAKATGLRTVKRGEITDYGAFVEAVKDWPDVRQFMADLANKVARAAAPTEVAGLRIVAEQRAY